MTTTDKLATAPSHPRGAHGAPLHWQNLGLIPRSLWWTRADTLYLVIIAILAFATRFIGLGAAQSSGTPVFDEKHYVPQAWDMVRSSPNPLVGGIESNPGYGLVVHPPLAKQIEAWGEMIFGYSPWGWRFSGALMGVLVVLGIMLIARQLSASREVAFLAGILAIFDGVLLVSSRFGMLDIFLTIFVVAAALFLILDHQQVATRMERFLRSSGEIICGSGTGPRLGFRWWRFAAGIALGMALSVKWSGAYYIAFFGLMSALSDAALRHRAGAPRPIIGALVRDVPAALASLVLVPALTYLWSWRAWFSSETAVYRHYRDAGKIEGGSFLNLLPSPVADFLYYHFSVLKFHGTLRTSTGSSHPWDSKPWSWLAGTRPILYSSATDLDCGENKCREMIYLFGTPAIWWLTVPVLLWGFYALIVKRRREFLVPLVGFAAGFIPWLLAYDRQMYFFYAVPLVPFTIVLLALSAGMLSGQGPLMSGVLGRKILPKLTGGAVLHRGTFAIYVYVGVVIACFAIYTPILYGFRITDTLFNQLMWMPSWK